MEKEKGNIFNLQVNASEIDEVSKLIKVFENFGQNQIIFGGIEEAEEKEEKTFPREMKIPYRFKNADSGTATVTLKIEMESVGMGDCEQVRNAVKKCCEAAMNCF